jgi:phosphatidylglycerophosphate synthase
MTQDLNSTPETPNPRRPGSPHEKLELSPFDPLVKRVFPNIEAKVPTGITANQITLFGHLASLLAVVFLLLSPLSRWWCPAAAAMLFVHWFTDTLDGPVARSRGTSDLGHYLDHFGDILGTVLIGLAVFMTPGSHLAVGVGVVTIYLLWMVHTQIRAELTGVTVIPPFGPTELHLVTIVALIAQAFVDFGRPLSWFGGLLVDGGPIPVLLNFDTGLTLVDGVGLLLCVGGGLSLCVEVAVFLVSLSRSD